VSYEIIRITKPAEPEGRSKKAKGKKKKNKH
jgi:hypothetical protein